MLMLRFVHFHRLPLEFRATRASVAQSAHVLRSLTMSIVVGTHIFAGAKSLG